MQQNWRLIDYYTTSVQNDGPLIPWYNAAAYNVASLPAGVQLGEIFWVKGSPRSGAGNAFMWVKATVGLTVGQLVAWAAPGTDTALTGSTTSVLNLTTGNLTVNAEVDNFVYVDGTTTPELRRIKANTAATITVAQNDPYVASNPKDADVFTTAPSNTNPVSIIRPWNVRVCTAVLQPVGVALGTVTQNYYTVIQVAGLALVSAVGKVLRQAHRTTEDHAEGIGVGAGAADPIAGGDTLPARHPRQFDELLAVQCAAYPAASGFTAYAARRDGLGRLLYEREILTRH